MSANKVMQIGLQPTPATVAQPSSTVPTSASQSAVESAKKMARKDKEFLWELDSQVKGQFFFFFFFCLFINPARKKKEKSFSRVADGQHRVTFLKGWEINK